MSSAKRYWLSLMKELGIAPAQWRPHWSKLDSLYRSAGRHYHTWRHIGHFLDALERFAGAKNTPALRLAAFYHDAVYDTTRSDNEAKSAELLAEFGRSVGLRQDIIEDAVVMVLATARHVVPEGRLAEQCHLFIDCDLSILGSTRAAYRRYSADIRLEFAHVSEEDFRKGRSAVMGRFLEREVIFHTPAIKAVYEKRARRNMAAEIALLNG